MAGLSEKDRKAASELAVWRADPAKMVKDLWNVTPEPWQHEVLDAFPTTQRICMKASKGVGKTACEAWLIWNFMLTRHQPKVACVAIDGKNLSDNLWTELALWRSRSKLLQARFEWTKTRIFDRGDPDLSWVSARTWPKTADQNAQSNTLAGLHADNILFVLDESGGMPEAIMASAEAALSKCVEGHILQAGNPTHLSGPLYVACTKSRRHWFVVTINADPENPRRSTLVSQEWAKEQIELYGRDNPWVMVNVFGEFPPSSINALIGPDEVERAMQREYRPEDIRGSARVMGVDVAREGDDASVICRRQGLQVMPFNRYRNIDGLQGAGVTSRIWREWDADACFLDATGGYGSSWQDQLKVLGRSPVPVMFSNRAYNADRFFNKRAEMYWEAVQWIKHGGALPRTAPELLAALTQTTYSFKGDKIILEDKKQIKDRLHFSPDEADAFVLTFAEPIQRKKVTFPGPKRTVEEYNPFAEGMRDTGGSGYDSYDPFR